MNTTPRYQVLRAHGLGQARQRHPRAHIHTRQPGRRTNESTAADSVWPPLRLPTWKMQTNVLHVLVMLFGPTNQHGGVNMS